MRNVSLPRRVWWVAMALVAACGGDSGPTPVDIVETLDFDGLFAPATASEVAAVSGEWATRSPGADGVQVEYEGTVAVGADDVRVRIVSHLVDGLRHYGAVLSADGLVGPAPVVVYAHGGDQGTTVEELLFQFSLVGQDATRFVWVVPSFRSETLGFSGGSWTSQGTASPWDRDVDDALSLLDVALDLEPEADPESIAVLGFSRGAGVGLLMGVRDERIDRIVEFFGPTDFFDPFVRGVVEDAVRDEAPPLPGLPYLDDLFIQPWARGEISLAQLRPELVRRSPVLFAERLPYVQLHHGTADAVVAVSQAESLIAAMAALGRTAPEFDPTLYAGGGHSPLSLPGSVPAAVSYLMELLPQP